MDSLESIPGLLKSLKIRPLEYRTEAIFLDEIQSKVLLTIQSHLCSFALRFIFVQTHTISYVFLQTLLRIFTVQLLYTVKEKELKEGKCKFMTEARQVDFCYILI